MKTLAVGVLAVLAGCAKSPHPTPVPAEQPPADVKAKPPEPAKEVPAALAAIFKDRNALHKRQTGALLTISAKWETTERTEAALAVEWSIDYDGPRRPFTILTPGRMHLADGRTTVKVWFARPDGTPADFNVGLGGLPAGVPPHKQKEWFSVSSNGLPTTGKILHGQSYMKGHFGTLPGPGSPPLWVQMEHSPTDRGDGIELVRNPQTFRVEEGAGWTLDAWTGTLWSPVVAVAVK